jgi:hypothetical protein
MIWRKQWALRLGVGASAPMKRVDMGTRGPESRGCVHGNPIHGMMTTGRYGSATLRSSARLCRGNLFRACGGWRAIREERDGNVYLSMQGPSPALPDVTGHHPGRQGVTATLQIAPGRQDLGWAAGPTSSATLCSKRRRSAAQPAQHLAARSDISYAIEHLRRRILKPRCKPRRHSWQSAFRPRTASCPDSTDLSNPSPTAADSVLYVSGSNNVDQ